jgi:hypothetical protein
MQTNSMQITIRINYPLILLAVFLFHALIFFTRLQHTTIARPEGARKTIRVVKLRKEDSAEDELKIRKVGSKTSKIKGPSTFERRHSEILNNRLTDLKKPSLSLKDLAMNKPTEKEIKQANKAVRPGTRPEVLPEKPKALSAISLKGQQINDFVKSTSSNAAAMSGDPRVKALNETDILVNLEVPEGVEPDELNKYELMFYSFQRRTAIGYINAFYKNLDKFERENPHLRFPMTDSKQVMTGRLTYDDKGNIKQIKMIRWSNEDRLQHFFEDVLKDMDTLHNPPQALWEKRGEFSIFFSFVVNG